MCKKIKPLAKICSFHVCVYVYVFFNLDSKFIIFPECTFILKCFKANMNFHFCFILIFRYFFKIINIFVYIIFIKYIKFIIFITQHIILLFI